MNMTDNMISMVTQAAQANTAVQSNSNTDTESGVGFQNLLEGKKTEGQFPLATDKDQEQKKGTTHSFSVMDYLFQSLALGQMPMDLQALATAQAGKLTGDLSLLDMTDFASVSTVPSQVTMESSVPASPFASATAQGATSEDQTISSETVEFPVQQAVSFETAELPVQQAVSSETAELPVQQTVPLAETAAPAASVETPVPQEGAIRQAVSVQQQGTPQIADVMSQNTDSQTVSATPEQPVFAVTSTQGNLSLQQSNMETQGQQQETGTQSETAAQPRQKEEQITVSTASSRPLFEQLESMPIRVGDPQPLDTTSGDFTAKLAGRVSQAVEHGTQQIEIQLSPENLGNVVVKLTRNEEGVLHVALYTDNERAARLLGEHSSALGMMLQNSGQGEVHIEVPQPRQEDQLWQQSDQQQGQNQGGQSREQQNRKQNSDDFLQQIRLGLFQMETQQI